MIKANFKEINGYYYIGDDAESFVYCNSQGSHQCFLFKDPKGNIQSRNCVVSTFRFDKEFKNDMKSHNPVFSYLVKEEFQYNDFFPVVAEAFVDFISREECSTPIWTSFMFAKSYYNFYSGENRKRQFDRRPLFIFSDPLILSETFSYNNYKKKIFNISAPYFLLY